ncbi:MAG TPA: sulfatase-like hydrolase/transferase, partial [Anseongella sp.]|nr:sulfatase-like hydrolase/transferase [Anseongella sp.]
MKVKIQYIVPIILYFTITAPACRQEKSDAPALELEEIKGARPMNVIFILSDDHRYDAMGFTGKIPGLRTPNMDRMAAEGVHIKNAFVSTALCSPSRASILTGQYAHTHTIVDNQAPMPEGLLFFPQYLQKAGYQTAFIGKWHMGDQDDRPQPGFDHWVSFRGQGQYYNPALNVNGRQVKYSDSTYMTDLLTDYAVNWLDSLDSEKPFFLYLSHKANHAEFYPAARHSGEYADLEIQYPPSMFITSTDSSTVEIPAGFNGPEGAVNAQDIPDWVRQQRYSWHGVDHMYHGTIVFDDFYRRYLETLLALDESIGRVLQFLTENGLAENTVVIYMGDNGFGFGE